MFRTPSAPTLWCFFRLRILASYMSILRLTANIFTLARFFSRGNTLSIQRQIRWTLKDKSCETGTGHGKVGRNSPMAPPTLCGLLGEGSGGMGEVSERVLARPAPGPSNASPH